ncbi:MAG: hypothetical protein C5B51_32675 [Terriglobia bacterium]|nr:MAG: hypothetical protein C5B51_32675 [Terriglobia bacterium]
MLRLILLVVTCFAGTACNSLPDSYPPPPQRQPLITPSSAGLSYFLSMSNPNAAAYIVRGIADDTEGTGYRWAYEHPVLRFLVPRMDHPRFVMDFALPERTFRTTGPVTLTFSLNGETFDRTTYNHPGQLQYAHDVPSGLVRWDAVNQVAIEPDKVWTSPADGTKLSFVISRVGFVE